MSADWTAWLVRYRAHLELEGLAERTIQGRTWLLGKFVGWCQDLGVATPMHLTVDLLQDYRRYRIQYVNIRGKRDRAQ